MRRHTISVFFTIILLLLFSSDLPAKQREIKTIIMKTSGREPGHYRENHTPVSGVRNHTAGRREIHNVPREIKQSSAASVDCSKIKRDGIYVMYENGIVRDLKTDLEWRVGPDKDINWIEARSWVKSLNVGGWRMPSSDELKTLYKENGDERNKTPLLKTTGWWIWSSEIRGSSAAWCYGFDFGHMGWLDRHDSGTMRVFAVRSRRNL